MRIKVLVCGADGNQHAEEREVPEDYLVPAAQQLQESEE